MQFLEPLSVILFKKTFDHPHVFCPIYLSLLQPQVVWSVFRLHKLTEPKSFEKHLGRLTLVPFPPSRNCVPKCIPQLISGGILSSETVCRPPAEVFFDHRMQ